MPGPNSPYTQLDADQVLRQSFEEANDRLRVDAQVTAVIGDVEVSIDSENDSILAVGTEDGTKTGTQHVLKVTSDLNLNVKDIAAATSLSSIDTKLTTTNSTLVEIALDTDHLDANLSTLSTSANQITGNSSLSSIDTKLVNLNTTAIKTVQVFTKSFDSITATYPSGTQEVYQSRIGGISGTVQETVTVNYTDTTKNFIQNLART